MTYPFAHRMDTIEKSFLDEILKFDNSGDMISFAGGLPNPETFPVDGIARAAERVFSREPQTALQYNLTEGWPPLRDFIADRYRTRFGMDVSAGDIIITTGSQQGQDLTAKLFIDPGDRVVVESPAYLGATESMKFYQPEFVPVPMTREGIDPHKFAYATRHLTTVFLYAVPNFQNPTGLTYSTATREAVARIVSDRNMMLLEDDPFGELRFRGEHLMPIRALIPEQTVLLGSFSKIVTPGLRIGWLCAPRPVAEKLAIAKQAADLHTSTLTQMILHQFLMDNDLDAHIAAVSTRYGANCDAMTAALGRELPPSVTSTRPEGGMFRWVTMPQHDSASALYPRALEAGVAFIPGRAFFVYGGGGNTFRLNFSNTDPQKIEEGIKRLGKVVREMVDGGDVKQ
jgi:2-aminoadipate transaminase